MSYLKQQLNSIKSPLIKGLLNTFNKSLLTTLLILIQLPKHSFSRSYRVNLPSSFNIVISYTLVYSTYSPVSVLVRSLII